MAYARVTYGQMNVGKTGAEVRDGYAHFGWLSEAKNTIMRATGLNGIQHARQETEIDAGRYLEHVRR